MAAVCKHFSLASNVLVVSPHCLACVITGYEVGRSDLLKDYPALRPSTACFLEQERGIWLELLE